jgi:hypothetical protein
MNDTGYPMPRRVPHGVVRSDLAPHPEGPSNLADVLERVLDKGIVIAGDIRVNLLDIELLTIKIRLLIASVDRAKEMGIDWWEGDPTLTRGAKEIARENEQLHVRLERLEERLALLGAGGERAEVTEEEAEAVEEDGQSAARATRRTVSPRTRK